jgi:hypothetical protein
MTSQAEIRRALTVLEARRLELEKVISDDLERKFLADPEPVSKIEAATTADSGGFAFEQQPTTVAGFSSVTWLA